MEQKEGEEKHTWKVGVLSGIQVGRVSAAVPVRWPWDGDVFSELFLCPLPVPFDFSSLLSPFLLLFFDFHLISTTSQPWTRLTMVVRVRRVPRRPHIVVDQAALVVHTGGLKGIILGYIYFRMQVLMSWHINGSTNNISYVYESVPEGGRLL